MAPPNDLVKWQIVEKAKSLVQAIDPDSNSNYWAKFDFVDIADPPPEGFLDRMVEVPAEYSRVAFVWHDSDPRELRDTRRTTGVLSLVVTAAERYEFDDTNPFSDQPPGFLPRLQVRARMESDLMLALDQTINIAGLAVVSEHADTRVPQIATRQQADPWVETELLFDVTYKYSRDEPWKT